MKDDHGDEGAAMETADSRSSDEVTGADQAAERNQERKASSLRGVQHLKGVQDIGTGLNRRMRAIPKREDHSYLDLYLLQKERERLTQEGISIGKRRARLSQRLADIHEEMMEKERKALENMEAPTRRAGRRVRRHRTPAQAKPAKQEHEEEDWRRMSIGY